ncbi:MAG: DNA methylase, partial [Clostridia bacterium]|nr:DNA methylase [Clostridia bacterium]
MEQKQYACIDLKSFYASAECIARGLDPMTTNLVVADIRRTEKTICLAVTPSLKAYGISGRARLFEVIARLKEVNAARKKSAPNRTFTGSSCSQIELENNPALSIDYITAPPRMAHYIDLSTQIYSVYLKHIAPEDIHVYSIDEVFIDLTAYLRMSGMQAEEFVAMLIRDVFETTGITAAAGIGPNLYLAKSAMDIEAKHVAPKENGVRIATLDEMTYRKKLWDHRPLTDFWRIGPGYARRLEQHGLLTMGDVARCSLGLPGDYYNEDLLYRIFGINAELLIDHAWGIEPCTITEIKAYRPDSNSICSGQVLQTPYTADKAALVVREMTDLLVLDLVDRNLVTDQLVLDIGYDTESLQHNYTGEVTIDRYGRKIPRHAHGTTTLDHKSSSTKQITEAVSALYQRIVNPGLLIRRINLTACRLTDAAEAKRQRHAGEQLDLFTDIYALQAQQQESEEAEAREESMQKAVLKLKKKYGKNILLRGMNLQEDATA